MAITEELKNPIGHQSRNYGIDALRIVSMLMIVVLHILGTGGALESDIRINYWTAWFLETACFCSVNCYALISGYIGVFSKHKVSNFVLLWCRVAFYSVLITILFKCFIPQSVGFKDIVFSFFPIISKEYWYFTAYAVLFLFIPVLNAAIDDLSKRQLGFILCGVLVFASLLQPVIVHFFGDVFLFDNGYSAWWLITLYLLGGFIRKHGLFSNIKSHRTGIFLSLYLLSGVFTWLSKVFFGTISERILGNAPKTDILINYTSVTMVASSVFLLLAFENIKLGPFFIRITKFLSPLAFSVYLIHVQPLVFSYLVTDRFIWSARLPLYLMVLSVLGCAIGIYILCSVIDLFREYLFKALKIKEMLNGLEERFKNKKPTS